MGATTMLALTAGSALAKYSSTRRQGEYEAHQLDVNASLADQQAADALARGKEAQTRQVLGTKQMLGSQRSGFAGQGVRVDTGSAADVAADTEQLSEMDRLMIEHNAMREAAGYTADATNSRVAAEQTRTASRSAARGTLLTAASRMYALPKPTLKIFDPRPTSKGGWGGSA
jgi:hypothetical protein